MARVWDAYLTEQDRAHVRLKDDQRLGFGQRPALLMIDLYRWVFGDEPEPLLEAVKRWPSSCGLAGWRALPYIQKLLEAARAAGIPVVYSTDLAEPNIQPWAKGSRISGGRKTSDPEMQARLARAFEIVDEVAPREGELVVRKSSPSAFFGTPLQAHLTSLGVDTLIVTGESTSGCVRAATVDGCTLRYRMMVVEECVFDRHEATHAMNLFDINQKYGDVIPLADALSYLEGLRGGQAAERELALAH
ncbi:MAG TPA: isochorismatase family protein [Chloroflexota bacterium]|nr:isochorismatase family protein [Chloroflexota bacterium]